MATIENGDTVADELFPGLMLRETFRQRVRRSERTLRKWQAEGKLVIVDMGRLRYVDVQRTLARLRGETDRE